MRDRRTGDRVLDEWCCPIARKQLTLVAHDLGGPAGFLAAARRADRIAALAAVNCFAWKPTGPLFRGMLSRMGSAPVRELDVATDVLARVTSTSFGVGRHWRRPDRAFFRAGIDVSARRAWHAYFGDARRRPSTPKSTLRYGDHWPIGHC